MGSAYTYLHARATTRILRRPPLEVCLTLQQGKLPAMHSGQNPRVYAHLTHASTEGSRRRHRRPLRTRLRVLPEELWVQYWPSENRNWRHCNEIECRGRESNPYALTSTAPSTLRVYQFHPLGEVRRDGISARRDLPQLPRRDVVVPGGFTSDRRHRRDRRWCPEDHRNLRRIQEGRRGILSDQRRHAGGRIGAKRPVRRLSEHVQGGVQERVDRPTGHVVPLWRHSIRSPDQTDVRIGRRPPDVG